MLREISNSSSLIPGDLEGLDLLGYVFGGKRFAAWYQ